MMTDLRFALPQLGKSPEFTLLAVITLTLGIGLNTGIFRLINDPSSRGRVSAPLAQTGPSSPPESELIHVAQHRYVPLMHRKQLTMH